MLKLSRNFRRLPSSSTFILTLLSRRFFASLSFSTSMSMQESTPTHRLTSATESCEMMEAKNSACRSEGVGGVRGREEVTMRDGVGQGEKARRSRWAFGGDRRTRICGGASCGDLHQHKDTDREQLPHLDQDFFDPKDATP